MATKIIALDAGHGLYTVGKQTPDGIKEWSLNDKVRDKVVNLLAGYDVDFIFLDNNEGNKDETLADRVKMYINYPVKVDAVVSLHHNAFTGKWNDATGVETYTDKNPTAADKRLAECVHSRLVKYTGLKNRGIKQADWYVINQDKVPAILTEGGFMDGKSDYKYITSDAGQIAYAKAVAEGLIEFLNLTKISTPTVKTIYRVRKTWKDAASQLGAFTNLDNAKKACKEGYSVFDELGKAVYTVSVAVAKKSNAEIAKEVVDGKWGNGQERKKKLTAAGYNYNAVQAEVTRLVNANKTPTSKKKTATEVAKEIVAGKGNWGNGSSRKKKLEAAGYNYSEVQSIINKLLKK